ncbi:glycosyltransferase family 2 protein [Roseomonas sp. USHLN139]|uniref:glycosyltransferase family 2 protein n=1 Tax=Roseomonas sp. USHLN139 TaxID=3081298 RepID=UPI003B02781D
MSAPLLTVGIPVFNEQLAITRAISSVLNQTWNGDFEILIVDDGSTDETCQVIQKISNRVNNIRLVRHETNRGRPAARNTLLREARGRYFAMLDADDQWYPDKLARQFAHLDVVSSEESVRKTMVCGNINHIDLASGKSRIKRFSEGYGKNYSLPEVLCGKNTPISQLALLSTDFFREVGEFDDRLRRAQDWDFLIRFFAAGGEMSFVGGNPLAAFFFEPKGRDPDEIQTCMDLVVDKHAPLYESHGIDREQVKQSYLPYIESFRAI